MKRSLDWHRQGEITLNTEGSNMGKTSPVNDLQAGCHSSPCQPLSLQLSRLPTLLKGGGIPCTQYWNQPNLIGHTGKCKEPQKVRDPNASRNNNFFLSHPRLLGWQVLRQGCKFCSFVCLLFGVFFSWMGGLPDLLLQVSTNWRHGLLIVPCVTSRHLLRASSSLI